MKDHMESHVDTANVNMFTDSCAGVEQSLTGMSDQVSSTSSSSSRHPWELRRVQSSLLIQGPSLDPLEPYLDT